MNKEKKVVIDIRKFCKENGIKEKDVCKEIPISRHTLYAWTIEAPEVVTGIFKAIKEVPEADALKILNGWQNPPFVLAFIRDFMIKHNAKFHQIIFEKQLLY